MIRNLLYLYIGGVIALLFESLVQWLHPEESNTDETIEDALCSAVLWPMMAVAAIVDLFTGKR